MSGARTGFNTPTVRAQLPRLSSNLQAFTNMSDILVTISDTTVEAGLH